jgi:hypothetical protein
MSETCNQQIVVLINNNNSQLTTSITRHKQNIKAHTSEELVLPPTILFNTVHNHMVHVHTTELSEEQDIKSQKPKTLLKHVLNASVPDIRHLMKATKVVTKYLDFSKESSDILT